MLRLPVESRALSYSELNSQANQLAHYLLAHGAKRGDVVAICLDRSLDFAVACVAAVKAGAAYLPLDSGLPSERLAFMVQDSQAVVVITTANFAATFSREAAAVVCLDVHAEEIAR